MKVHRFEMAVAFFLLAGNIKRAVLICTEKLNDFQLALLVARLTEGERKKSKEKKTKKKKRKKNEKKNASFSCFFYFCFLPVVPSCLFIKNDGRKRNEGRKFEEQNIIFFDFFFYFCF